MDGKTTENLGFSDCMGPKLRQFVERQLLLDLEWYLPPETTINLDEIHFDWSESCIEGHRTSWLDGDIENFSGISLFDQQQKLVAEGWMQFIETDAGLEVFWQFLDGGDEYAIIEKDSIHWPQRVWNKLTDDVRLKWTKYAPIPARLP